MVDHRPDAPLSLDLLEAAHGQARVAELFVDMFGFSEVARVYGERPSPNGEHLLRILGIVRPPEETAETQGLDPSKDGSYDYR